MGGVGVAARRLWFWRRRAPSSDSADDPVEGTVRTFTYDDSIEPEVLDPFEEEYSASRSRRPPSTATPRPRRRSRAGSALTSSRCAWTSRAPLVEPGLLAPIDTDQDHRLGQHGSGLP